MAAGDGSPRPPARAKHHMETLGEAIARLEERGFAASFAARPGGLLAPTGAAPDEAVAPESLVVEEIVRFEGESDPEDEAVLFALRSRDGALRGTFVASYGTQLDPDAAAAIERLEREPAA